MARLLWRDAQDIEGSIELTTAEITIGRAVECRIRTEDAMVSRRHARVFQEGDQYVVEDLGSTSGIFFNDERVERHRLTHGDAIRCGSLWLRFVDHAKKSPEELVRMLEEQGPTAPAPPPTDAQSTPASVEEIVELRLGKTPDADSKPMQLLREACRSAIEADRANRPEDAHKLRHLAAIQFIQSVEVSLYRRLSSVFTKEVRAHWIAERQKLELRPTSSMERTLQAFLERGDRPSLNLLGRMLTPPGPAPAELASLLKTACRIDDDQTRYLFELGAIRNVLAHLPEYEEDAGRSIEGPRGLFLEERLDDGTRKLVVDPAFLVSLEQICSAIVRD